MASTLLSIQYLRGVAATMVVYHHARDRIPSFAEVLPSSIGQAGVDLFFVISGFIMVVTTWSTPPSPRLFLMRRLIRIGPTYWLYTTLLAVVVVGFPGILKLEITPQHYVYSLLFIPHESPSDGSTWPLLQPGWTLNFEMFFYCLFALVLLLGARRRAPCVAAVLLCLAAVGWFFRPTEPILLTYTCPLALEFAFGACIGHAYRTGSLEHIGARLGWAMIASGALIAMLATGHLPPDPSLDHVTTGVRVMTYGVAASLVVIGALVQDRKPRDRKLSATALTRLGHAVGDSSYALYLSHLFTIGLLRLVWLRAGLGTEGLGWALAFVAVAMPVCVAVGLLAYSLVERPLLRATQRLVPALPPRLNMKQSSVS